MAQLSFLQRTLLLTVAIAANLAMAKHQKRLRGSQEKKRKVSVWSLCKTKQSVCEWCEPLTGVVFFVILSVDPS